MESLIFDTFENVLVHTLSYYYKAVSTLLKLDRLKGYTTLSHLKMQNVYRYNNSILFDGNNVIKYHDSSDMIIGTYQIGGTVSMISLYFGIHDEQNNSKNRRVVVHVTMEENSIVLRDVVNKVNYTLEDWQLLIDSLHKQFEKILD